MASLAEGERIVKYKEVLYALQGIDGWSVDDRTGWALRQEGLPAEEISTLDVELWPLEDNHEERLQLWRKFPEEWLQQEIIEKVDAVKNEGLSLYRVRCNAEPGRASAASPRCSYRGFAAALRLWNCSFRYPIFRIFPRYRHHRPTLRAW
ncbi:MAG: hypothetical protein U5J62_02790 [Desulfurivibrio sp.]|nr:hypothetical protein [Desulfurivibrio sp.]